MRKKPTLRLNKRDRKHLHQARELLLTIAETSRELADRDGDVLTANAAPIAEQLERNLGEFESYLDHLQTEVLANNYRTGAIQYEPDLPF